VSIAVVGSMKWALHFPYIAAYLGERVDPATLATISDETPFLIDISPVKDQSFFTLAVEKAAGAHSGLDSTIKHLLTIGLVEDAPTLEGPWSQRLQDARDPNDRILLKTAARPVSGIIEVKGNFTRSAIFKRAGMSPEAIAHFDRRTFVVVFYLGEQEAQQDLFKGRVLDKLKGVLDPGRVRRLARANFGDAAKALDGSDDAIVERAARERLLRVMVVIAGEGPKADGIPEMFYPSEYLNRDPVLRHVGALITDGRYSGATYGPCIGHASPEALEGGLIGALRTGDLVFMDTKAGRIDVLDEARSWTAAGGLEPVALDPAALAARPELAERIAWMRERRLNIPATVRLMLDATTTCMEGVTPVGLFAPETEAVKRATAPAVSGS
jgi:dihydroxyacid dehydratase/phosphogluconate dehydratase